MKSFPFLLIFLYHVTIFAQDKTGYAKYVFEQNLESLKEAADSTKSENVKAVLLKMIEESRKNDTIYFDLYFTENESLFSMNNNLTTETDKLNLYKIEAQQIGLYFQNKEDNKIINQKEFNGTHFLIEVSTKTIWELTDEEKRIGKYLCKKALLKQGYILDGIRTNAPLEVWYTPEIHSNFGPIGLGGLPGLIVELKLNKLSTIRLKDFFYSNNIIIKKPSEGKLVSQEEFRDFVKQSKIR